MSNPINRAIKKRANEIKVDVIYSKKGHYNAASIWDVVHYVLGIITVSATAIIGLKNSSLDHKSIVFLALLSATLVSFMTFLKPQEKAAEHKQAGDDFDNLLQVISNFVEVDLLQGNDEQHSKQLAEIVDIKTKLNKNSLPIPKIAYLKTKKGINKGEASYTEEV